MTEVFCVKSDTGKAKQDIKTLRSFMTYTQGYHVKAT